MTKSKAAAGIAREWDGTVVLVADPSTTGRADGDYDRRIDQPTLGTIEALRTALEGSARRVTLISDLQELTDRVGRLSRSLVFPYWFGQNSRSRHALVPAICEANGMMFVGADAFAKVVCNDKELSKTVCRQSGLDVPVSGIVRTVDELRFLRHLRLPVMVKPNYEGTSLGISERNRCESWKHAMLVAEDLLEKLGQPLVVEEFISGREASACLMRTAGGIEVRVGAWVIDGRPDYLNNRVFSAGLKTGDRLSMTFENIRDLLPDELLPRMRDCFLRLGKVDLLRIDVRLGAEGCKVIELTPDIYLGPDGEFASAYQSSCGDYSRFVLALVRNCIEGYGAEFPM